MSEITKQRDDQVEANVERSREVEREDEGGSDR